MIEPQNVLKDKEKRLLIVANVSKEHIRKFHIPFIVHMRSLGWKIDVACRMDAPIPECDRAFDLPCDRNPFRGGLRKSTRLLEGILQDKQYDAIICNTLTGSIVARLAKKSMGAKAPKLFYINHGLHFFEGASLMRWIMGYPMEKMLAPLTDVFVMINDADYQMAKKHLNPKAIEKIHGIGVDLKRFRNCQLTEETKRRLRNSIGVDAEDFVLSYVAEINDNKNQEMLLDMFCTLQMSIPNIKMLLIGPEHDGGKLQERVKKEGLDKKVYLLGWRDDIPELLNASDLYVASSKSEGLGLNLIEAMACNLPLVASMNRGHSEIVQNGYNGYIVDLNDVKGMAGRVLELYNDSDLRSTMIDNAQRYIAKFEVANVIKEEEKIICAHLKED